MITEDYVSFETAKLLKEKGFDVYVSQYYNAEDGYFSAKEALWNWNIGPRYSAPTIQMAMKWLREVHNLHIQPEITTWPRKGYFVKIYSYRGRHIDFGPFVKFSDSYEEACEVAIKYCLENLI